MRERRYPAAAPRIIPSAEVNNPRVNPKTADAAITKGLAGSKQRLATAIRTAKMRAPVTPRPPSQAEACSNVGISGK